MRTGAYLAYVGIACLSIITLVLHGCAAQRPSTQQSSVTPAGEESELVEQQSEPSPIRENAQLKVAVKESRPVEQQSEQAQTPRAQQLTAEAEKEPQEQQKNVSMEYRITQQTREYGDLRLSVATTADLYDLSTEQVRAIAQTIVRQYQHEARVSVFFYNSGRRPDKSVLGRDLALCRFDWTPAGGLRLRFDQSERRERKPEVLASAPIPKYEVLETIRLWSGRERGSILVPSFSRLTPPAERERVARLIMAAEGLDDLVMYATREALEADSSRIYSQQHPEAKQGILGAIIDGRSIWE
jgi:hypothetical protein